MYLITGNPSPKISEEPARAKVVLVWYTASKYWSCNVRPAKVTVSSPIMPDAQESSLHTRAPRPRQSTEMKPVGTPTGCLSIPVYTCQKRPTNLTTRCLYQGQRRRNNKWRGTGVPRRRGVVVPPIEMRTLYLLPQNSINKPKT